MPISYGGDNITFPDASTQNTSPKTGFVNRIINGGMTIDQRNAGAAVTPANGAYTLDRWKPYLTQASKYSVQKNAGAVTPPSGFTDYLGVTSLSAYSLLAGDYFVMSQPIEGYNMADFGWGTANAQTVTLSFRVRSSLTGTFGGCFGNNVGNRSYPFTYTISNANTWTTISVTVPGDTAGAWQSTDGAGIYIYWSLGTGTTYSGTAGSWSGNLYVSATGATSVVGTNGATFYITGVQLEKGSTATPFEFRSYGQELALCQRYTIATGYRPCVIGVSGSAQYFDGSQINLSIQNYNVYSMRTFPASITTYGTQGTDWAIQTSGGANQTGFTLIPVVGIIVAQKASHGISNASNLQVLTTSGNIVFSSEL